MFESAASEIFVAELWKVSSVLDHFRVKVGPFNSMVSLEWQVILWSRVKSQLRLLLLETILSLTHVTFIFFIELRMWLNKLIDVSVLLSLVPLLSATSDLACWD